jgi:hypothetical protein
MKHTTGEKKMLCPFCGKEAPWVENKVLYGRNYGKSYMCYYCRDCDAYIGCHKNTREALGTMATKELRELRKQCHLLFDPLWKSGKMTRPQAYNYLYEKTKIKHIAWTTKEDCLLILKSL